MNSKVREHNASPLPAIVIPVVPSSSHPFFRQNENQNTAAVRTCRIFRPERIRAFSYVSFQFMQLRSRLCTLCILKFAIRALLYQYLRIPTSKMEFESRENVKFVYKMWMKLASFYNYYYKIYKFDIFILCLEASYFCLNNGLIFNSWIERLWKFLFF